MDKYHPGYFGKVGMRQFHLTRNKLWRPAINVDKLWSLVPAGEKKDLKEDSEVVPVIDVLRHGYGKVLGNGRCVFSLGSPVRCRAHSREQPAQTALYPQDTICVGKGRVSRIVFSLCVTIPHSTTLFRAKIKEAGGVVSLIA